jgi:glycosyltransferase involved in cell wall biosynthesis
MALVEPGHPYYETWIEGVEKNGWKVVGLPRSWELHLSHQLMLYLTLCPFVRVVHLIDIELWTLFGGLTPIRRILSFATVRLIILWPRMLRKHVVYSFGNVVPHEFDTPYEHKRHELICSLVNDVISLSPALTESLIKAGIDPAHIWPCEHADISDYFTVPADWPDFRHSYGISDCSTFLLHIGSIRPYKGVETVIEAVKRAQNPNLRLVIAGRPSSGYTVEMIQQMVTGEDRIILGPLRLLTNEEMGWMFKEADFCLLPYRNIGHSGLVCQSLGLGVPIIASSVGCLPDYVNSGTGLLFHPGDADQLAYLFDNCLHSFNRDQASAAGTRLMKQRTPERIGKRLVSIYNYHSSGQKPESNWLF